MSRQNKNFKEFWVMINLSGPRYWKVTADSIHSMVDAPGPNDGPVISFGEFDFRAFFENGSTRAAAKKHFLREYSEKSRIIFDGPKKPIYATPTHRISEFEHSLYPGAMYLDKLLTRDNVDFREKDRIVGFSLEAGSEEDGNFSKILILYALRTDGSMSFPEISLNPHDVELVLNEFSKSNGIILDEIILYPTVDIFEIGVGTPYPHEEDISGMAYSNIQQSMAAVFSVLFLGITGINAWNYLQAQNNKQVVSQIQAKTNKIKNQQGQAIADNLFAYGDLSGLQPNNLFSTVESLYAPQIQVFAASANLKDGTTGKISLFFLTEDTLTRSQVPEEVVRYLSLQKEYKEANRESINYSYSGKKYEAIYSFKAVDDAFSNFAGR